MKIKEIYISRYGPLNKIGKLQLKNFNLIFGKNENGKTLTIDALVKLLIGKNIKDFEDINRVDEIPIGYVVIQEKGKEIKLPEKGYITQLTNLSPSEFRNIFIIRNSDLSITKENEFYLNITDRLLDIKTKEISKIKEILRDMGKLTLSREFKDIKEEKLKSRIEDANRLINEIIEFEKTIKEKKLDEVDKKLIELRDDLDSINQKIEDLEIARKREKFEKGKKTLDTLKENLKKLKDLEIYNEEEYQLWIDTEKEIKNSEDKMNKIETSIIKYEQDIEKLKNQFKEIEKEFRYLENKKKFIDNEIKLILKDYEEKRSVLLELDKKTPLINFIGIFSVLLLGISLLGIILRPSIDLFYYFSLIFLLTLIYFILNKYKYIKHKTSLDKLLENIKLNLTKYQFDDVKINDNNDIFIKIQNFEKEYSEKQEEILEKKQKIRYLEDKINELKSEHITIEKEIQNAKKQIEKIMIRSQENSSKNYLKKLKTKSEIEKSINSSSQVLISHFGETNNLKNNILMWEKELSKLEEYKNKSINIPYDEDVVNKLNQKKQEIEIQIDKHNEQLTHFRKKMEEIERKANEILRSEEYFYCKTFIDLSAIKNTLLKFIEVNEQNRVNVLEVMKIIEEIENAKKEKVSHLFGKDSNISKYFFQITNGLYTEVLLNQENHTIVIKRKDNVILEPDKLSIGAYDQLYFSIRLALGDILLKENKGFFIMDDPFIKADPERLIKQINLLKMISELGWQIIYFTAKGEVLEALEKDIKEGMVHYIEIKGISL